MVGDMMSDQISYVRQLSDYFPRSRPAWDSQIIIISSQMTLSLHSKFQRLLYHFSFSTFIFCVLCSFFKAQFVSKIFINYSLQRYSTIGSMIQILSACLNSETSYSSIIDMYIKFEIWGALWNQKILNKWRQHHRTIEIYMSQNVSLAPWMCWPLWKRWSSRKHEDLSLINWYCSVISESPVTVSHLLSRILEYESLCYIPDQD